MKVQKNTKTETWNEVFWIETYAFWNWRLDNWRSFVTWSSLGRPLACCCSLLVEESDASRAATKWTSHQVFSSACYFSNIPRWDSSFRPDLASSSPILGPLQICSDLDQFWPDLDRWKNVSDKKDLKVRNEVKLPQMKLTIGHKTPHQESSFRYSPDLSSSPPVLEML